MKVLNVSLATVVLRFYLAMAAVIVLGFLGQFILAAVMGFVLATTCILGLSFYEPARKVVATQESEYNVMEAKGI